MMMKLINKQIELNNAQRVSTLKQIKEINKMSLGFLACHKSFAL